MKISFNCRFFVSTLTITGQYIFLYFSSCLALSKAFTDMLGAGVMLECKRGCHKGVDSP